MSRENCQGYFVCLHLTYAISPLSLMLLLLEPQQIYTSKLGSLSSTTDAHWKRRMENILHFVHTNKCCCLQAAVTDKVLFRHTTIANFLEISWYHFEAILLTPALYQGAGRLKNVMLMLCWTFAFILTTPLVNI